MDIRLSGPMERRYVVERIHGISDPFHGAVELVYAAIWQDPVGTSPLVARFVLGGMTVTEVKERMDRQYPGSVCAWEPEETRAVLKAAADAAKGEQGGDRR